MSPMEILTLHREEEKNETVVFWESFTPPHFNFPASEKLYRLLKKDGHNFKKKDIEDFLLKQKEHEMLKVKQVKKKQIGHITAFTFKENAQMDIFDISKYSKNNKNYWKTKPDFY